MKSFKHEHLFYLHLYMSKEHTLSFQLHRLIYALDVELFLQKSMLPKFSEITQAWHCLRNVFMQSDEFTY